MVLVIHKYASRFTSRAPVEDVWAAAVLTTVIVNGDTTSINNKMRYKITWCPFYCSAHFWRYFFNYAATTAQ